MFNIRGNYVRQTAEHRGTRHAECRTHSLTRTPARSPVIWWWKMKITSWRYASTTINLTLKEIRLQNFLKTFSEKKSNQTFNMASGWLPPFGSSSGGSQLWPIKTELSESRRVAIKHDFDDSWVQLIDIHPHPTNEWWRQRVHKFNYLIPNGVRS